MSKASVAKKLITIEITSGKATLCQNFFQESLGKRTPNAYSVRKPSARNLLQDITGVKGARKILHTMTVLDAWYARDFMKYVLDLNPEKTSERRAALELVRQITEQVAAYVESMPAPLGV